MPPGEGEQAGVGAERSHSDYNADVRQEAPPAGCGARTSYDEDDALRGNIGFESRGSLRWTFVPFGPL